MAVATLVVVVIRGGGDPVETAVRGGGGGFGGGENFTVGQQSGISKTNAIGINFSDKWGKKVDVQGSYFFNNSNNVNDNLTQTQTHWIQIVLQTNGSISESNNYNHRINMRFEYRIDSFNSIIISPSLNFQKNRSFNRIISSTHLMELIRSIPRSVTAMFYRTGYNLRNNILYPSFICQQQEKNFFYWLQPDIE